MTDPTPPPGRRPDALGPTDEPHDLDPIDDRGHIDGPGPIDPIDEAASAALDGEAFEPGAALDADAVAARADELAGIRAQLAAPVAPPDPAVIDAHIAAALSELALPSTDSTSTGAAVISSTGSGTSSGPRAEGAAETGAADSTANRAAAIGSTGSTSTGTASEEGSDDTAGSGEADGRDGAAETRPSDDGGGASVAPVVPLESRRRRSTAGRWLAVAAAVAVVALAIPVVRSLADHTSSSSNDTASVASADTSSPASEDRGAVDATGAQGFSTTTVAPLSSGETTTDGLPDGDIGQADDPVSMAALVRQHAPDPSDQSTTQSSPPPANSDLAASTTTITPFGRTAVTPACDAEARAQHPGLGALRYAATATYQSIPVSVAVYEVPGPTTVTYRLMVSRVDTCAVLLDLPYP